MDDSDEDFRHAVLEALTQGSKVAPKTLKKEIEKVRKQHRDTQLCDQLSSSLTIS